MLSPLKASALMLAPGRTPDLGNVESDVLQRWERVQKRFGKDLGIKSGFRDPTRNANAGGAKKSQHMHGKALDIDVRDMPIDERKRLIEAASAEGFTGIGVYNNSLHFDTGPRRYWGPSYRSKSLPGWASGTIKAHMAGLYGDTKVADAGSRREQIMEEMRKRGMMENAPPADRRQDVMHEQRRRQIMEEMRKRSLMKEGEDATRIREKAAIEGAVGQVLGENAPTPDADDTLKAYSEDRPFVEPTDLIKITPHAIAIGEIKKFLPDKWKAALDNIIAGSSLGFSDELTGAANVALDRREGESVMDTYNRSMGWDRERQKEFREKYPLLSIGSEMAGGFAWAPVGGAVFGTGKTLGGQVVRAMGEGALMGSAYGAGTADDKMSRVEGAKRGAALGLAAGAIFPPAAKAVGWAARKLGGPVVNLFRRPKYYVPGKGFTEEGRKALRQLGYDADQIADDMAVEFGKRADAMGTVPAGAGMKLNEQGIPAMLQNVTRSTDDWHFLEHASKGAHGAKVQRLIKGMLDEQADAVARRATAISEGFGGAAEPNRLSAAEATIKGLLRTRDALKDPATEAYKSLGFTVADGRAAKYLPKVFDEILSTGADDIAPIAALDPSDTPIANRAMNFARRIAERAEREGKIPGREVDRLRQILNKRASGTGNDIDALRLMRMGFDEWLDATVKNGLLRGDPEHLKAIREAPALYRAYAEKFKGTEGYNKFVADMVKDRASPEDVARWLWGMSNSGRGAMTDEQAKFLKSIVGETSEEWSAVKQGMFETLMRPNKGEALGPKALSNNIRDFFNPKQDTHRLANVIFSADEKRELLKFADAVRELVPPEGTVNYSNSAITMAMIARDGGAAARSLLRRAGDAMVPGAGQFADVASKPLTEAVMHRSDWLKAKALAAGIKIPDVARTGRGSILPGIIALDSLGEAGE